MVTLSRMHLTTGCSGRSAARPASEPERLGYSKGTCVQHVLIIHEVDAYPGWKAIFDQAADMRKRAGEISYQLLRDDSDANRIVHFSEWSSLDKARCFFESPELEEIRRRAGVKAPDFMYLQEIERGVL